MKLSTRSRYGARLMIDLARHYNAGIVFFAVVMVALLACGETSSYFNKLEGSSAKEAMALANKWRQQGRDIKSHVTSENIIFALPGGQTRKIALPEDQMVVSVAPYERKTHT